MNLDDDDLKASWKQRQSELADSGRIDELASRVFSRTSWFERVILRRDWIETAAAIFVIVMFAGMFFRQESWLARVGAITVILGAIEILVVLHWTRRRGGRPQHDLPLAEFCAAEIARVDRQIWLLRHVNWWYSGPILLGCCLLTFGRSISWVAIVINLMCYLAVGWFVYWLNQRAVRTQLIPLREELATTCETLVDDSSIIGDTE